MRDDDKPALVVDTRDRLFPGQIARDGALEEQPDDLALTRADLLADDHTKAVRQLAQPEPSVDRVVVGRADHVDARRAHSACLLGDRRATVRRSLAVRVHVHADTLRLGVYAALPFSCASSTTVRTRSRNRDTSKRRAESRSAFGSKRARRYAASRPRKSQKSPRSSVATNESTSTGGWTTSTASTGTP